MFINIGLSEKSGELTFQSLEDGVVLVTLTEIGSGNTTTMQTDPRGVEQFYEKLYHMKELLNL